MECITSVHFSIITFKPCRGLRQEGDPLYPTYLFFYGTFNKKTWGLGVRPSAWFNSAALAKLGWKLLKDPSNWWVKITTAKYLRRSTFFLLLKKNSSRME